MQFLLTLIKIWYQTEGNKVHVSGPLKKGQYVEEKYEVIDRTGGSQQTDT
jgi:hypothetical protein